MTVVVDTSVIVKWFHADDEAEVGESRAILAAHRDEILTAHILDLGIYKFANVLLRALHWSADDTADQIDDLLVICGPPLAPVPQWRREAATLAHQHRLTFYDALFVAAAGTCRAAGQHGPSVARCGPGRDTCNVRVARRSRSVSGGPPPSGETTSRLAT